MSDDPDICATCQRALIPSKPWLAMGADRRAVLAADNFTRKAKNGACQRCYIKDQIWRQGALAERREREAKARADQLEDIEWMVETGESWEGVLMRLGISDGALQHFLRRAGRGDLIARLDRRVAA